MEIMETEELIQLALIALIREEKIFGLKDNMYICPQCELAQNQLEKTPGGRQCSNYGCKYLEGQEPDPDKVSF
ncbi:MAG: hypothetical protein GY757_52910 [bacterium]|nr:hypothetical protein [bacterium]